MKVFIVDDSLVVRERLVAMLSELPNIQIIGQAADAPEAINSIRELHPDAVVLDIRMPHGTGIDVLEAIKNNNSSPIIIILTNYPYPQYQKKCMDLGAHYFFDKSSEFDKVIGALERLAHESTQT